MPEGFQATGFSPEEIIFNKEALPAIFGPAITECSPQELLTSLSHNAAVIARFPASIKKALATYFQNRAPGDNLTWPGYVPQLRTLPIFRTLSGTYRAVCMGDAALKGVVYCNGIHAALGEVLLDSKNYHKLFKVLGIPIQTLPELLQSQGQQIFEHTIREGNVHYVGFVAYVLTQLLSDPRSYARALKEVRFIPDATATLRCADEFIHIVYSEDSEDGDSQQDLEMRLLANLFPSQVLPDWLILYRNALLHLGLQTQLTFSTIHAMAVELDSRQGDCIPVTKGLLQLLADKAHVWFPSQELLEENLASLSKLRIALGTGGFGSEQRVYFWNAVVPEDAVLVGNEMTVLSSMSAPSQLWYGPLGIPRPPPLNFILQNLISLAKAGSTRLDVPTRRQITVVLQHLDGICATSQESRKRIRNTLSGIPCIPYKTSDDSWALRLPGTEGESKGELAPKAEAERGWLARNKAVSRPYKPSILSPAPKERPSAAASEDLRARPSSAPIREPQSYHSHQDVQPGMDANMSQNAHQHSVPVRQARPGSAVTAPLPRKASIAQPKAIIFRPSSAGFTHSQKPSQEPSHCHSQHYGPDYSQTSDQDFVAQFLADSSHGYEQAHTDNGSILEPAIETPPRNSLAWGYNGPLIPLSTARGSEVSSLQPLLWHQNPYNAYQDTAKSTMSRPSSGHATRRAIRSRPTSAHTQPIVVGTGKLRDYRNSQIRNRPSSSPGSRSLGMNMDPILTPKRRMPTRNVMPNRFRPEPTPSFHASENGYPPDVISKGVHHIAMLLFGSGMVTKSVEFPLILDKPLQNLQWKSPTDASQLMDTIFRSMQQATAMLEFMWARCLDLSPALHAVESVRHNLLSLVTDVLAFLQIPPDKWTNSPNTGVVWDWDYGSLGNHLDSNIDRLSTAAAWAAETLRDMRELVVALLQRPLDGHNEVFQDPRISDAVRDEITKNIPKLVKVNSTSHPERMAIPMGSPEHQIVTEVVLQGSPFTPRLQVVNIEKTFPIQLVTKFYQCRKELYGPHIPTVLKFACQKSQNQALLSDMLNKALPLLPTQKHGHCITFTSHLSSAAFLSRSGDQQVVPLFMVAPGNAYLLPNDITSSHQPPKDATAVQLMARGYDCAYRSPTKNGLVDDELAVFRASQCYPCYILTLQHS